MTHKKEKPATHQIFARVNRETADALRRQAVKEDRSVSWIVSRIISQAVKPEGAEVAK